MPRVPLDRPATYQDLVALPDGVVAEIVDGELHASPRPAAPHARAATALVGILTPAFDFGRNGPGGWVLLVEPELHLHDDVLVPDLAGWRRERMPTVPNASFLRLAPDWVCELLSPSTERLDRFQKLAIYARQGVAHVWLVNPTAQTLEVFHLADGRWVLDGVFSEEAAVRAAPFDAVPLELWRLWGHTAPPSGAEASPAP